MNIDQTNAIKMFFGPSATPISKPSLPQEESEASECLREYYEGTFEGIEYAMGAAQLKNEWDRGMGQGRICMNAENVKPKKLKWLEKLDGGKIFGKAKFIKINPLGPTNLCHLSCEKLEEAGLGERVLGYNVTGCSCGNYICLEIHTVLKEDDGKYHDYTRDFDDLPNKWFIPLKTDKDIREWGKRTMNFFSVGSDKCRCGTKWDSNSHIPLTCENKLKLKKHL